MAKVTPMMKQYLQIKAQYQDAFLFFRLGDFYEMFYDDAIKGARELEITLTERDSGQDETIPMCGIPYHSAENYIKILMDKGYKWLFVNKLKIQKKPKVSLKEKLCN